MSFNLTSLDECINSNSPFCKINIESNDNFTQNLPTSQGLQFGELTNSTTNNVDAIYKYFIEYVGNLMMTKNKLMGNFCAYIAKIKSGLAYGSRIIVVVIPDDGMALGSIRPLHTLQWLNFQTRFTTKEINIRDSVMPESKNVLMNSIIERIHRDDTKTQYKVNGHNNLKITLFKRKDSIQDWSEKNKLYVALSTFCCSVDII